MCMFGEGHTHRKPQGMTLAEYRAHYSVWAVLASPLIHGADVTTVGERHPECFAMLLNPEIIAVNQDRAAHPPRLASQTTNYTAPTTGPDPASTAPPGHGDVATTTNIVTQVFVRPLGPAGIELAVVLLNRGEAATELSTTWVGACLTLRKLLGVITAAARCFLLSLPFIGTRSKPTSGASAADAELISIASFRSLLLTMQRFPALLWLAMQPCVALAVDPLRVACRRILGFLQVERCVCVMCSTEATGWCQRVDRPPIRSR